MPAAMTECEPEGCIILYKFAGRGHVDISYP